MMSGGITTNKSGDFINGDVDPDVVVELEMRPVFSSSLEIGVFQFAGKRAFHRITDFSQLHHSKTVPPVTTTTSSVHFILFALGTLFI